MKDLSFFGFFDYRNSYHSNEVCRKSRENFSVFVFFKALKKTKS